MSGEASSENSVVTDGMRLGEVTDWEMEEENEEAEIFCLCDCLMFFSCFVLAALCFSFAMIPESGDVLTRFSTVELVMSCIRWMRLLKPRF